MLSYRLKSIFFFFGHIVLAVVVDLDLVKNLSHHQQSGWTWWTWGTLDMFMVEVVVVCVCLCGYFWLVTACDLPSVYVVVDIEIDPKVSDRYQ